MELSSSWVQITSTEGFGALLQNGGNNAIQIAYATEESGIDHVYSLSSRNIEKFPSSENKFLFARSLKGEGTLNVQEADIGAAGGGSGSSIFGKNGFIDYNDLGTSVTPLQLTPNTWTDVPNDGAGPFSNSAYTPDGVGSLMDNTTGYLDFSQLVEGDVIQIRLDFKYTPNINNAFLECRYVLGDGAGEYPLLVFEKRCDNGSGRPYDAEKGSFMIYMGDSNTQSNAGRLQVRTSAAGTLVNAGVAIQITRK